MGCRLDHLGRQGTAVRQCVLTDVGYQQTRLKSQQKELGQQLTDPIVGIAPSPISVEGTGRLSPGQVLFKRIQDRQFPFEVFGARLSRTLRAFNAPLHPAQVGQRQLQVEHTQVGNGI